MILCLCPNPSIDMFTWVDDFLLGQVNRACKEERFPGGKGVHVALAAAELGEDVKLLGFWGGPAGKWIKERCEKAGVSCYGPETEGWSRTCLSFKSGNRYDDTELLGPGPEISEKEMSGFMEYFDQLVARADCVCMSGSWPQGAPADGYAQLIRKTSQAGKKAFLDCTGEQLVNAISPLPFGIHLNRAEGAELFKEENPERLSTLLNEYCEQAAITAGAEGLYLKNKTEHFWAKCPVEKVYSSVGSGDCLVAGLAVAYCRGLNTTDAARLAVACGAANCISPDLGMLKREDVELLLNKVVVEKL